jgi:hypothetical protein
MMGNLFLLFPALWPPQNEKSRISRAGFYEKFYRTFGLTNSRLISRKHGL